MNHCKHFHFDGVMHTPCPQCEIDHLRAEIERLKAELAESKKDAAILSWLEQQNMNIDNPDAWCVTRCDFTGEDVPCRFWVGSDLRGAIREVMKGK